MLSEELKAVQNKGQQLMDAVEAGDIKAVNGLLEAKGGTDISEDDKQKAFISAARNGRQAIMDVLLNREGFVISPELIGRAFEKAAGQGQQAIVTMLLDRDNTVISPENKGWALKKAAQNGHQAIVEVLLDRVSAVISPENKGLALQRAAQNGHQAIVEVLLDRVSAVISPEDKGWALKQAARKGRQAIVQMLLDRVSAVISPEDKNIAFQRAAQYQHWALLPILLDREGSAISADTKASVFHRVVDRRAQDTALALLAHVEYRTISGSDKYAALLAAICNNPFFYNTLPLITALLNHKSEAISVKDKGAVLYCVAEKGYDAVVTILLADPSITKESKKEALRVATSNRQQTTIRILEAEKIAELIAAVESGNKEAVINLLNDVQAFFSEGDEAEVLYTAAKAGHQDIVTALLDRDGATISTATKGRALVQAAMGDRLWDEDGAAISEDDKGSTPTCAAAKGREAIVTMLLARGDAAISSAAGDALVGAVVGGQQSMVIMLLDKNDIVISPQDKGLALVRAAQAGSQEIVDILLNREGTAISVEDKGKALVEAAIIGPRGHSSAMTLLNHPQCATISDSHKSEALSQAVGRENTELTIALLQSLGERIPEQKILNLIDKAIKDNATSDDTTLVAALVANTSISVENKGRALCFAAEGNHSQAVHILLADPSIPASFRAEAFRRVIRKKELGDSPEEQGRQAIVYELELEAVKKERPSLWSAVAGFLIGALAAVDLGFWIFGIVIFGIIIGAFAYKISELLNQDRIERIKKALIKYPEIEPRSVSMKQGKASAAGWTPYLKSMTLIADSDEENMKWYRGYAEGIAEKCYYQPKLK